MFGGRKLVIATKHEKERVIAPILESELGAICFIPNDFDSDLFGTFTGEIERTLNPVDTARNKCQRAMELTGCDLGVASEGSFGPHPVAFFASADDEILIFIDAVNDLEIIVREVSLETNFGGKQVSSENELLDFANSAMFPSHGLIVRPARDNNDQVFKGITNRNELIEMFEKLSKFTGSAYVETDMRAMHNPTRMKVIGDAAIKLAAKIMSLCPECETRGFGIADRRDGLRCSVCGSQTRSTLSLVHRCRRCGFEKDEMYPDGKELEDPKYCDFCNP